jgi:membrane associated rhomboid family serine protease
MKNTSHSFWHEIHCVILFIGFIWAVYLISLADPRVDHYGVVPRTAVGLTGIAAMPFLHANLHHLVGNTIPLAVLLLLLAGSRARSWWVVIAVTVLGGLLLWLFGRPAVHIGASGLISGLTSFLILSGIRERRVVPLLTAVLVGFLYGSSLVMGVVPRFGSQVSWDGHLCGAVAGVIVACALTGSPGRSSQPSFAAGHGAMLER